MLAGTASSSLDTLLGGVTEPHLMALRCEHLQQWKAGPEREMGAEKKPPARFLVELLSPSTVQHRADGFELLLEAIELFWNTSLQCSTGA